MGKAGTGLKIQREERGYREESTVEVEGPAQRGDQAAGDSSCPSCDSEIPPGARSCPFCHKGVYRTCYCGWQLPADERQCPNCGADWSQSMRVARKSRSRTPRRSKVLRYAAIGATTSLLVGVLLYIVVAGLAMVALPDDGALPAHTGERLPLAAEGALQLIGQAVESLARYARVVVVILLLLGAGALVGVVAYLARLRMLGSRSRRSSRHARRKRRTR